MHAAAQVTPPRPLPSCAQILLVAALVDLVIALVGGESGLGAFVEPLVILLILVANGAPPPAAAAAGGGAVTAI